MKGTITVLAPHPLRIDVGDLVRRPGTSKPIQVEGNVPGLGVGLGRVAHDGNIDGELLLEALIEGILVSGTVSGEFELECSRCLTPFTEPFSVRISEVYAYEGGAEPGEEGFTVSGDAIDLEPALRDEILLAVPQNPLHAPACRGLCAVCGQDLNVADCGHSQDRVDIRWEPLRRLKEEIRGSGPQE